MPSPVRRQFARPPVQPVAPGPDLPGGAVRSAVASPGPLAPQQAQAAPAEPANVSALRSLVHGPVTIDGGLIRPPVGGGQPPMAGGPAPIDQGAPPPSGLPTRAGMPGPKWAPADRPIRSLQDMLARRG